MFFGLSNITSFMTEYGFPLYMVLETIYTSISRYYYNYCYKCPFSL